jgi:hypothetical protein
MHEVIGHASGQLNPGISEPHQTLKNYASTLEEARADLVRRRRLHWTLHHDSPRFRYQALDFVGVPDELARLAIHWLQALVRNPAVEDMHDLRHMHFGALLVEMLTGQPPGYALNTDGAGQAGPIIPVQPAPPRLLALAQRCLLDSPGDRPASMREIDAELGAVATAETVAARVTPILTPPPTAADRLRPSWERTVSSPAPDAAQLQRQGFRSGVVVAAAVVLGLIAIALFIVPAYRAPAPRAVAAASPPVATNSERETTPEPEPDLAALAGEKSKADELRAGIGARLSALQQADSASWAAAETAAAAAALARAAVAAGRALAARWSRRIGAEQQNSASRSGRLHQELAPSDLAIHRGILRV